MSISQTADGENNIVKDAKILSLILFLVIPSLSQVLMLHINDGKPGSAFCSECDYRTKSECVPIENVKMCDSRRGLECVPVENVRICNFKEPECILVERAMRATRYECAAGKTVRKKIVLKKAKIELEKVVSSGKFLPENLRRRTVLKSKMNSSFLKDFNKMALVTGHRNAGGSCYNINIYDNEILIATFETNGVYFYDRKNKLMYEVDRKGKIFNPEEHDLLRKYWGIFEENRCR